MRGVRPAVRPTAAPGHDVPPPDVPPGFAPRLDAAAQFVTASLTVDYLGAARAGDWLQAEADRIHIGNRLCLVTLAIVRVGGQPVALGKAAFSLVRG